MRAGVGVHPAVAGRAQAQQVRVRFPAAKSAGVCQVVGVIPGGHHTAPGAAVVHRTAEPFAARRPHRSSQVTVDFAAVGGLAAQQQRRSPPDAPKPRSGKSPGLYAGPVCDVQSAESAAERCEPLSGWGQCKPEGLGGARDADHALNSCLNTALVSHSRYDNAQTPRSWRAEDPSCGIGIC
jgi:hypothetical protein